MADRWFPYPRHRRAQGQSKRQRWGQPGQQQGRRIPSFSSETTRSTCCFLVSGFLTEIVQQIHSLRARGVMSSHFASASGSEMRAFRKSAGTLCTAPEESAFLAIDFILHRYASSLRESRSVVIPSGARSGFGTPMQSTELLKSENLQFTSEEKCRFLVASPAYGTQAPRNDSEMTFSGPCSRSQALPTTKRERMEENTCR